jgi:hypothetical protein
MSQGFSTAYTPGPESEKLSELRERTDRQILSILHSRLELGLNFAALAEETFSEGNPDQAKQLFGHAEEAVIEVKQLLSVLTEDQHRTVGPQLNRLQEALDHLGGNLERPRSSAASRS